MQRLAGQAAADAPRAPFGLGDPAELLALLTDTGFESVELGTHSGTGQFPSVRVMVEADLRGWLPVMDIVLSEDLIASILAEA